MKPPKTENCPNCGSEYQPPEPCRMCNPDEPLDAAALGYKVIAASAFEVGLVRNGQGVRTWFAQDFDGAMPTLEHPKIQEAIRATERMLKEGLI